MYTIKPEDYLGGVYDMDVVLSTSSSYMYSNYSREESFDDYRSGP